MIHFSFIFPTTQCAPRSLRINQGSFPKPVVQAVEIFHTRTFVGLPNFGRGQKHASYSQGVFLPFGKYCDGFSFFNLVVEDCRWRIQPRAHDLCSRQHVLDGTSIDSQPRHDVRVLAQDSERWVVIPFAAEEARLSLNHDHLHLLGPWTFEHDDWLLLRKEHVQDPFFVQLRIRFGDVRCFVPTAVPGAVSWDRRLRDIDVFVLYSYRSLPRIPLAADDFTRLCPLTSSFVNLKVRVSRSET